MDLSKLPASDDISRFLSTPAINATGEVQVLTRRFLDTVPIVATGFDIEAELSVQAQTHGFRVDEHPIEYRPRHPDSASKLNT